MRGHVPCLQARLHRIEGGGSWYLYCILAQREETVPPEFERVTLSRVPESLVQFGYELVARGRVRGGVSQRRRRRARAVNRHGICGNWGGRTPLTSKEGGVGLPLHACIDRH